MVARDQMHDALTRISRPFSPRYARRRKVTRAAMPRPAPHAKHILAWLVAASCAASCAAHADDVTPSPAAPADPSKLTAGDPADDRLPLSRAQLFSASAVGGDVCRCSIRLVLRLYQLQQREVLHQPGGRGHGLHRHPPDARSVRFRYRCGLLLLPRRDRTGPVELLGGARDRLPQTDREAHARGDARLCAGRLAIRRLGHLRGRRDLARSADRTASDRRRAGRCPAISAVRCSAGPRAPAA